jgi:hypothetical protein
MDDYDEDFEEGFEEVNESGRRRFIWQDVIVIGLDALYEITTAVGRTLCLARNTAAMHTNWVASQREFHQQAAKEIETLTGEVDG